ncbi:response regulator [Pelovirga terrestris]|uniref:Response regulator n=1 Tax=Pelovirga terrestris TaxID=2771352 RepID=A0A8J6QNH1_9BACT|nr:response regulator [Pelovirga terrestris]
MQEKTALLLDDDVEHRQQMMEVLTSMGYVVHMFANPISYMLRREGHFCSENKHCFDLILVGNRLPGMSGIDFLQRLKRGGCCLPDHYKAVFCSDLSQEQQQQITALGCCFFTKPTSPEDIRAWLDT